MTLIYLTLKQETQELKDRMLENDFNLPNSQTFTKTLFKGFKLENDFNLPNSQTIIHR